MQNGDRITLSARPLRTGGKSLYLDYRVDGKRIRENLQIFLVPEKTAADKVKNQEAWRLGKALRDKRESELNMAEAGIKLPPRPQRTLFADYFPKVLKEYKNPRTKFNMQDCARKVIAYRPNVLVAGIDREFMQGFINHLHEELGLQQNSIAIASSQLKTYVHKAVLEGIIPQMPDFSGLSPRFLTTMLDYLSLEQLKALIDTPCSVPRIKNAFLFSCFTGIRFSDIKRLCPEMIEDNQVVLRQYKTSVPVRVPISKNAKKYLPKTPEKNNLYFPLGSNNSVNEVLKRWSQKALGKDITFHLGRHTFATLALSHGADLFTVSKILGHTDVKTTQVYVKVLDEGKKKAVESIPEL